MFKLFFLFLLAGIKETNIGMCRHLGQEINKMGQHNFWAQKLTLWVRFWAHN